MKENKSTQAIIIQPTIQHTKKSLQRSKPQIQHHYISSKLSLLLIAALVLLFPTSKLSYNYWLPLLDFANPT
jgi:hypothetical protein